MPPRPGAHSPKGLMEDLQDKVLLLGAGDTQQVGSVSPAEQVSLQPAQLLLQLGEMKHLHTGNKTYLQSTKSLWYYFHF